MIAITFEGEDNMKQQDDINTLLGYGIILSLLLNIVIYVVLTDQLNLLGQALSQTLSVVENHTDCILALQKIASSILGG